MMGFDKDLAIDGKKGKMWIGDEMMCQVYALNAKANLTKHQVKMAGKQGKQEVVRGYEISGSFTMTKINSTLLTRYADSIRNGNPESLSFMSELPSADGEQEERILLTGVTINELPLIDWTSENPVIEETLNYTASDFEIIGLIE